MGFYLSLSTTDGTSHPDWDVGKYVGDSEVLEIIEVNGGLVRWPEPYDPWRHGDPVYRPADLDALSRARWPEENADRWRMLVRILREQPEYWISPSF